MHLSAWLKFFRIVNAPTVPGDVLVGAAAVVWEMQGCETTAVDLSLFALVAATFASLALYGFGLADNDIVGAKTDGVDRPIPAGEISLRSARIARGLCLFAAMGAGFLAGLSAIWWGAAFLLAVAIVAYNRTKGCVVMGLCRGLNVVCGGAALMVPLHARDGGFIETALPAPLCVALVWVLYIAVVTKFSEGEENDPAKKRRVGFLIGALVYLQLGALLFFYMQSPCLALRNLLLVGAGLLILLRLMKRAFPKVSGS